MMVLVTYDVSTEDADGRRRLRQVAKACVNVGQRVQNSVFECNLDPLQLMQLKHQLEQIIDKNKDSVRYYNLGKNWGNRVEHVGAKETYNPEGIIII
ncbi:CRISPR-associated endonuclease Cas2 [Paenibacillus sp. 481]|uniref:CRISPR-associated endonuclease Cas2 n=1 Tax=Paenibacillus sp. 481 TaxID=2835869 RepID=UPI001E4966A3|nr:CRISPR-associated endonuclease Cas2 [Paenibacillus sp. 481]UHA71866.1 CRISPR-associated endonuclease Cas2 [Paenibacillus sp. 481]